MASYDVIIKNGLVFDGKGNKPEQIDIGVKGDEIKKIGDLQNKSANEIIDATDKYVAPGFIDITNHSDTHWTLFTHPSQESLLQQGITTIIGGNCGSSLAPFFGQPSMEDIGRWVDISGININWQTIDEFLAGLEKNRLALNFGTLVGFNTLSQGVKENSQINLLLKKSLADGAWGISTNFSLARNNKLFGEDEIISIFKTAQKNNAVTKHHLEDEGKNLLPALAQIIHLARKSGARIHISHFKALGKKSWHFFSDAIEMIKNARREEVSITCDFFPYTKTGSNLLMLLPSWFKRLPNEQALCILQLKEDSRRKNLVDYLTKLTLHYENIIIASSVKQMGTMGQTINDLMKSSGLSGEEIILNLLEANNLRVSIFNEVISEENIEKIAVEKFSVVASDGMGYTLPVDNIKDLPHPRSFGAFPKIFRWLVKEMALLNWETVIHKMTGLPAEIMGIKNRGTIVKNGKADIIVFNPEEISDWANYNNPFQYSKGVEQILINGAVVLKNGEFMGQFAGKILRK